MKASEKLFEMQETNNSMLCIGLDIDFHKMPEYLRYRDNGMREFLFSVIDSTKHLCCGYKLNFAFYEQYGLDGYKLLKQTIDFIPNQMLKIADAKRGDIGNTSKAYAKSCFEYFETDAVTVNPLMGEDSVKPFFKYHDKMVFLLALTSNPSSADFQRLTDNGKPIYQHIIEKSQTWAGADNLGFVIGATHPEELADVRELAPNNCFLIPGIGAQGGDIEAVLKANNEGSALINVSRAILYAGENEDYLDEVVKKAEFYSSALKIQK